MSKKIFLPLLEFRSALAAVVCYHQRHERGQQNKALQHPQRMTGDKVKTSVQYYFSSVSSNPPPTGLTTLVNGLYNSLNNSSAVSPGIKGSGATVATSVGNNVNAQSFFNNQSSNSSTSYPKAYLNVLFFDEQFKFDAQASSFRQIGTGGYFNPNTKIGQITDFVNGLTANKNGYCYIYISNESDDIVFFDNLTLEHVRGQMLEETHYYPFGLTMQGISSRAAGSLENKRLYNGKELQNKEFSDGSGLELYDFGARQHDPQIGRWTTIDPLAHKRYWATPYNYVQNNPMNRIDPNGLTDYTLDKKTGDVKQIGDKNDKPDRVLQTDKNGNVKKKGEGFLGFLVSKAHRGEAKVAIDGIEKGILKDGQNFQNKDQVVSVGGNGQPSVAGVKSFTLQLSEYVGKEIKGFSYSSDGSGNVTDMVLGKYIKNEVDKSYGTTDALRNKYGDEFSFNNIVQEFHTHPNGQLGATQSNPELSQDVKGLQNDRPFMPNASFIILYRITGQTAPAEYDYTHEYIPPKK